MKIDRLMGVLTVLLRNGSVTAPYLAAKFEVSRRTVGRDVDALCRAGIPVVTRQGGGGGISIADGFRLDKSVLTADELASVVAALRGMGSVLEKPVIERTLDKLSANKESVISLKEPVVINLASHYKGSLTEKIELIKRAVKEQRIVEFDYYYEKGQSARRAEPYFVVFQWTAWYLFGYCLDCKDWRMFKLQRLWGLKLSDKTFAPREIPPEKLDFGAHIPDDKKLVALFDPSARYLLVEAYGLGCCAQTPCGKLLLETGFTNKDFIVSWLMGFGGRAKVLEPADVADEIKRRARNILDNYI